MTAQKSSNKTSYTCTNECYGV